MGQRPTKISTILMSGAVALLATGLMTKPAPAADYTLKVGFVTFKDQQHEWGNMLKTSLEKATNGRIEVKLFPRGQLGAIPRQIEGVQLGTVESFIAPTDFYAGVDPRFGVFGIPLLFRDKPHAAKVLQDKSLNDELLAMAEPKGMVGVTVFPHSMDLYLAKEPIRSLSDFKGKKMRINASAPERAKMKALGATGIPMPLGQVLPSLQRGAIDGTKSGMIIYVIFKYHTISTVATETNDQMLVSQAMLSKAWLDKLPADLRRTTIETAKSLQPAISQFSIKKGKAYDAAWAKAGGTIHKLPDADLKEMHGLLAGVGDEVTEGKPALRALYNKVKATAAKY